MRDCPVCKKLEVALREREEKTRRVEEEYARAYAAAFREEMHVSFDSSQEVTLLILDRSTRLIIHQVRAEASTATTVMILTNKMAMEEEESAMRGTGTVLMTTKGGAIKTIRVVE